MRTSGLTARFEAARPRLRAVAYRMLGSVDDADDAVQDAWLRLSRNDTDIDNIDAWLTTVVARICLNMLRARRVRREEELVDRLPDPIIDPPGDVDPEHEALLADSVGLALFVVLDTLPPDERLAFVLHDVFAVPFAEIAPIVDRTPEAARKLASRARLRVQGAGTAPDIDLTRQRQIVEAFLAASRNGDFDALLAALDPDVVLRSDQAVVRMGGGEPEVRGAMAVAGTFSGRARAARLALVDGVPGAVWAYKGRPRVVFGFTITDGQISAISLRADPALLAEADVVFLET